MPGSTRVLLTKTKQNDINAEYNMRARTPTRQTSDCADGSGGKYKFMGKNSAIPPRTMKSATTRLAIRLRKQVSVWRLPGRAKVGMGALAGRRTSRWRDPFLGGQAGLGGVGEGDYLEGGDGVS